MSQQIEKPGYQRLQVTDQEQMTWENDRLNRKPYADRLTTLIKNTEGPYVIGLTSPWGSGKTFFLQAWHKQLVDEGKFCIYFNAWEKDASGDPLCNMIAVVQNSVEELKKRLHDDHPFKKMLKKCYDTVNLKDIIKATPQALKIIGNSCTMTGDTQTGAQLRAAAETVDMVSAISSFFTSQKGFKDKLADFSKAASQASNGFPLFIIVDELDRCRPSYAIDLLESIKHLFNVPHVVFLLAVDSTQLLQQVEHTFGLKACVEDGKIVRDPRKEYLEKFFDIYYTLPFAEKHDVAKFILLKNKRLDFYFRHTNQYKEENMKLPLFELLTSDHGLFKEKSLRRIIQDIELFLLYITCYDDLKLEDIIFSFWVIMKSKERIFDNDEKYIKLFKDETIDYIAYLNKIYQTSEIRSQRDTLTSSMCAYLFIKLSMCKKELVKKPAESKLSLAYYNNKDFFQDINALYSPVALQVRFADEVAPTILRRLQCLEDFSTSLPVEATPSTVESVTTPA